MTSLFDFEAKRISGEQESLSIYRGKVVLVVNVASRCVLTAQYASLEAMYQKYKDRGFVILGFPCDQFMKQELAKDSQVAEFCSTRYNVTFPMFARVDVNGKDTNPIYLFLRKACPGWFGVLGINRIQWNFTKFLVDREGNPVERFGPGFPPTLMYKKVEALL